jgi:hypothetical protein
MGSLESWSIQDWILLPSPHPSRSLSSEYRISYLQAPVFLGAQLHTLRARAYFCLKMGRMFELKHDCGSKTIMPKREPVLNDIDYPNHDTN